jgi:hypothetical protein
MTHLRHSFLLHTLLVLSLLAFPQTRGDDKEDKRRQSDVPIEVSIVPPAAERSAANEEGVSLRKAVPHASDKCKTFYGGIGVQSQVREIEAVYRGYPAHLAGIKVGDLIVSDGPIRGEIGTPVTIVIQRGMRNITFHLIRDKICTD